MSVEEAGRKGGQKGGQKTAETHGRKFYEEIGSQGRQSSRVHPRRKRARERVTVG